MYFMFPRVTLEHFERSNAIEIRNGIMLDFHPGLPHTMYAVYICMYYTVHIIHTCMHILQCYTYGYVIYSAECF